VYSDALKGRRLHAYGGELAKIARRIAAERKDALESFREDLAEMIVTYRWSFSLSNYFLK
jgi:hypothetical protein